MTTTNIKMSATQLATSLLSDLQGILDAANNSDDPTPKTDAQQSLLNSLQGFADLTVNYDWAVGTRVSGLDWERKRILNQLGKKLYAANYHTHPHFIGWLSANARRLADAQTAAKAVAAAKAKREAVAKREAIIAEVREQIRDEERAKLIAEGVGAKPKPVKKTKPKADDA